MRDTERGQIQRNSFRLTRAAPGPAGAPGPARPAGCARGHRSAWAGGPGRAGWL